MNYISSLYIEGLKKFQKINIQFNKHMNILVGENEAGKSTILEAIKIVMNQQYKNADKAILKDLFNVQMVESFKKNPKVETLPFVYIELHMELDPKSKNSEYFYGENNINKTGKYGISFECCFDRDIGSELDKDIEKGKIPYEYYTLRWTTFAGLSYQPLKRPLNFLSIDTSTKDTSSSFNYFNRALFGSCYDEATRMEAKNEFRDRLNSVFSEINLPDIDEKRRFGINDKKVILETILSVYEDSVSLENRGSGMESLIKTQIALDRSRSHLDTILLEEPENHLCLTNLNKMLQEISSRQYDSQIIITTHSNMIASRLNLNNVLWITFEKIVSLKDIEEKVANFFVKADNNNFLQMLLSTKVILVEGTTEFLLLPKIYKQITKHSIEEDGVCIIPCNGISFKHYLSIAENMNKRIAILTDNDKNSNKIEYAANYNEQNENQHYFMGYSIDDWTWEASFYNLNKDFFEENIKLKNNANYFFHGIDCGKTLGKMLNQKVNTAYKMLISDYEFEIPQYIKDAIIWLNK